MLNKSPHNRNLLIQLLPLFLCSLVLLIMWALDTNRFSEPEAPPPFGVSRIYALLLICCALLFSSIRFRIPYQIGGKAIGLVFILATGYNTFFNPDLADDYICIIPACICTASLLLISYALFKWLACILWGIILLLQFIQKAAIDTAGVYLDAQLIGQIMAAPPAEILAFLSTDILLILIIGIVLALVFATLPHFILRSQTRFSTLLHGCCILFIYYGFLHISNSDLYNSRTAAIWPVIHVKSFYSNIASANTDNERLMNLVNGLADSAKDSYAGPHLTPDSGIVCVLHIGESVRADRLGLNGWKNNTTPYLQHARKAGQLINFEDCTSSHYLTLSAFLNLLTNAENYHYGNSYALHYGKAPTCNSVTNILEKNNFTCSILMEKTSVDEAKDWGSMLNNMIYLLTKNKAQIHSIPCPQSNQVQFISEQVRKNKKKNLFYLLNNSGSHIPYHSYDTAHPTFIPTSPTAALTAFNGNPQAIEEANNAYDNTIHYTDTQIKDCIETLKGRPFVYIYIGDHGEYLNHDGMWGRGELKKSDQYHHSSGCKVPFFIIFSPELQNMHPHFTMAFETLRRNQGIKTSHAHLFHTLLGIFGIKSPYYEQEKDLCSPAVINYTGSDTSIAPIGI